MNRFSSSFDKLRRKVKEEGDIYLDVLFIVCSIFAFSADVVLDIILAVNYFADGNVWFFVLTVCCIIIPASILTLFNIWWYENDTAHHTFTVSAKLRIVRKLLIFLLMASLLRNFEALYNAIKSLKSRDKKEKLLYYFRMKAFITDVAILTVFETFMESGPQLVLQLYIFAQLQASNPNIFTATEMYQMVKIVLSLLTMAAAYGSYQRSLRLSLNVTGKISIPTMLFVTAWRFFDITSRVIALGLFASVFPWYLLLICSAHFIAMFIWIRAMKTEFCDSKTREFLYNLVLAEVFVFFYFNPKNERTQRRYTIYYILMFFENTTLICLWYYYYSPVVDFRLPAFILQFLSFVLAIILMVIYYYFLHPSIGKIRQKSKAAEDPLKIEKINETNVDAEENQNMKTEEPAS